MGTVVLHDRVIMFDMDDASRHFVDFLKNHLATANPLPHCEYVTALCITLLLWCCLNAIMLSLP